MKKQQTNDQNISPLTDEEKREAIMVARQIRERYEKHLQMQREYQSE